MNDAATYVIELTPPGRAAVAVVLVAGPAAVEIVSDCTTSPSKRRLAELPLDRIALFRWGEASGEEVIICRRAESQVEVHCHGGSAAVSAVMEQLVEHGCRQMSWRDWLRATEADPIRADAKIALADTPTERTAAILLDQFHGSLTRALHEVMDCIKRSEKSAAVALLDELITRGQIGVHLTTPWLVVIAGPPNVGKSSLLNALAGFQRAIVSSLAGTTRDVVTLRTAIDGWPVLLADTAGLRDPGDELEAAGVARTEDAIAKADLLLAVRDASAPVATDRDELANIAIESQACPTIEVWNKSDLLPPERLAAVRQFAEQSAPPLLVVSAATGVGIAELVHAIGQALVPVALPPGAAVPFASDQIACLKATRDAVLRGDAAAPASLHSLLANPASP
jgi:tRNA modification GTPase